ATLARLNRRVLRERPLSEPTGGQTRRVDVRPSGYPSRWRREHEEGHRGRDGPDVQRLLREMQGEAGLRRPRGGFEDRDEDGQGQVPGLRYHGQPHPRQGLTPAGREAPASRPRAGQPPHVSTDQTPTVISGCRRFPTRPVDNVVLRL